MTRRLDYFPDRRHADPYLTMLFAGLEDIGVTTRPARDLLEHLVTAAASDRPGVLHVHGAGPIQAGVTNHDGARARVDELTELLGRFVAAGGRLIWSVHDVSPHDERYVEASIQMRRALALHAEVIHVPGEETFAALGPSCRVDRARVVVVPHSSYLGVYPDRESRVGARRRLGMDEELGALVTLGQIRPHHGIERLLDAFTRDPLDDPRLHLLVAGGMAGAEGSRDLAARLASTPRVVSHTRRVPRREVQTWLRAGDLAVLPPAEAPDVGALLLAETFGLPVVAPRTSALVAYDSEPHVRLFDPEDFEVVLARAVRELVDDRQGAAVARESAFARAVRNPPELMAQRFARAVAPLFEG